MRYAIALSLFAVLAPLAEAAEIHLSDGTIVIGTIIGLYNGRRAIGTVTFDEAGLSVTVALAGDIAVRRKERIQLVSACVCSAPAGLQCIPAGRQTFEAA